METTRFGYGYAGDVRQGFEEALKHAKSVLARHGFGVQAEINISDALKAKLGVNVPRQVILGVCNPALAYRAIQEDAHITVLLPCNVTVAEGAAGTHLEATSPRLLVEATHNPSLSGVASEAEELLLQALAEL
jgi:uncharacterized protein (DUF302 family)